MNLLVQSSCVLTTVLVTSAPDRAWSAQPVRGARPDREAAMFLRDHWYVVALSSELAPRADLAPGARRAPRAVSQRVGPGRRSWPTSALTAAYPFSLGTRRRRAARLRVPRVHLRLRRDLRGRSRAGPDPEPPRGPHLPGRSSRARGCGPGWAVVRPDVDALPATPWLVDTERLVERRRASRGSRRPSTYSSTTCSTSRTRPTSIRARSGRPRSRRPPSRSRSTRRRGSCGVFRHMNAVECPPFYSRTTGLEGTVDRWQDIDYTPPASTSCTRGSRRWTSRPGPTAPTITPST